jgi:hypothetical protein
MLEHEWGCGMSESAATVIPIASFGALLQELIHWYALRSKLDVSRYDRMMQSKGYWTITALMVVASGVGTWIWCHGGAQYAPRDYLLYGAAFPLVVKKAVSALGEERHVRFGEADRTPLRDYFQLGS